MALILTFLYFTFGTAVTKSEESIISEKLFNQSSCWNNGDIECFMQDYWKSDSLMYIGKSGVTYGWQNTLDNYKIKYPTKDEMGKLSFEIVQLKQLDDKYYFMVGKWHLERVLGDVGGHFSLIWENIDGEWLIISDHSS